jgi:ankyrin repeat protein
MGRKGPTAQQELRHLESHVEEALEAHRAGHPQAVRAIRRFHPRFRNADAATIRHGPFTRRDAALVVAREHGFPSWDALRDEAKKGARARWNLPVEDRIPDEDLRRAVRLADAGDARGLTSWLRSRPDVARRRLRLEPSGPLARVGLLELVASTFQRRRKAPSNVANVLQIVIKAGRHDRTALGRALDAVVSRPWTDYEAQQRAAIRLLVGRGADPKGAMARAVFQGGFDAADELVRRGGPVDLVVAASVGRVADVRKMIPRASATELRRALALGAVNGQTEAVGLLLDSGLPPGAFNPRGFYEHSTPLHQAVWFDHPDTVRLLVERGADLAARDKVHDGTPLSWAVYGKRDRIARYLRSRGAKTTDELARTVPRI